MTTGKRDWFLPRGVLWKNLGLGDFFKKTKGERKLFLPFLELEHPSHIHG